MTLPGWGRKVLLLAVIPVPLHHMNILRSQNKITDFSKILAWIWVFNITLYLMVSINEVVIVSAMISCAGFVRMFFLKNCK